MKRLWAPWRMDYLTSHQKKNKKPNVPQGCIFCDVLKQAPSAKNLVLFRGLSAFVIMNKYPYANGHLMVIPNRHVGEFTDISQDEHAELGMLLARCHKVLQKTVGCNGFNLGMNLGMEAGAGVPGHLHYHIVPRWAHDHNFMPTIAGTRVIPEHMLITYKKIRKSFLAK